MKPEEYLNQFMKIFLKMLVSFDFSRSFFQFASSGREGLRDPYTCIFLNFEIYFRPNFRKNYSNFQNCQKNFKNFIANLENPKILFKLNRLFHRFLRQFLKHFSHVRGGGGAATPYAPTPSNPTPIIGESRSPPLEKFSRALHWE